MANGGDLRFTAAGPSIAPYRVINLSEQNQSLLHSLRYYTTLSPQETNTCMQSLFNLMTSNEEDGAAQFSEVVLGLDDEGSDFRRIAMLLTSDLDRFLEVARNKNGSDRIQDLLGIINDVDTFFVNAILTRFFHVMTDEEASRVVMQGMRVFSEEKRAALYNYVLHHALHLACDRTGNVVLKKVINEWSDLGDMLYRDWLLFIIAQNAVYLSYHVYGNHVVQHVLSLHDLRCTHNVAVNLNGYCFDLSFTKFGGYVVQKLLDTEEGGVVVVGELLRYDGGSLVRLAKCDYGNYVVMKALRVMQERNRDLFLRLANKLMPFVHSLRGRNIGAFLYWLK